MTEDFTLTGDVLFKTGAIDHKILKIQTMILESNLLWQFLDKGDCIIC